MKPNICRRFFALGAAALLATVLAGCGGASSSNIDDGVTYDPRDGKTIFRTLANETDMEVWVELWINDRELVDDTIYIRPRSYINVEIAGLELRDYIKYYAEFDNRERTEGTFDEDGTTIFKFNRSRSSVFTEQINGKAAVKPGGEVRKIDARKYKK
jgi:hypothetical protein